MASIVVREVWQFNLEAEFHLIHQCLHHFRFASIDTEFPGTIYTPSDVPKHLFSSLSPSHLYSLMKQNVDELRIIQLGLTLSDAAGNLPRFGTGFHYIWQFNFRDFDADRHLHNPDSISLLKRQGIDFSKNKQYGIDSRYFAEKFKSLGLGTGLVGPTWITFHGLYDFGLLIKLLTGRRLPMNLEGFMVLVQLYFGTAVYDLKPMARAFGLHGGLERVAGCLNLDRAAGKSHQAGSDSLLTMQVFIKLMHTRFTRPIMQKFSRQLYGISTVVC